MALQCREYNEQRMAAARIFDDDQWHSYRRLKRGLERSLSWCRVTARWKSLYLLTTRKCRKVIEIL